MAINVVTNFNELAIRAPRPGFFVGDCVEGPTNPITKHCSLTQTIPFSPRILPLGTLTRLPTEILHIILSHLDIKTILKFRIINQHCAAIISSSQDFTALTSFPKALSAMITMECYNFTLGFLAASLRNTRCSKCKDYFGELLYLITAERVCWSCWRRYREFIPKAGNRKDIPEILDESLVGIPQVSSVRGRYGEPFPLALIKGHGRFFDRNAVVAELERLHGTTREGVKLYSDPDPEPERVRLREPESAEMAALLGRRFEKPKNSRYTTFLRAPYFDAELQEYIAGYFCRACIGRKVFARETRDAPGWRFPKEIWHEPWRRYTREDFRKHLEKYGNILRNELDGTLAHDSLRREKQTPDDVQWEMYAHEDRVLDAGMGLRDDQPMPFVHNGKEIQHNCQ